MEMATAPHEIIVFVISLKPVVKPVKINPVGVVGLIFESKFYFFLKKMQSVLYQANLYH